MDWITHTIHFIREWAWLIALLYFVLGAMAADFFPRVYELIALIESKYPHIELYLFTKEQELIDRYEILPLRIRNGFALIGGKATWSWLVTRMYRVMRERTRSTLKDEESEI